MSLQRSDGFDDNNRIKMSTSTTVAEWIMSKFLLFLVGGILTAFCLSRTSPDSNHDHLHSKGMVIADEHLQCLHAESDLFDVLTNHHHDLGIDQAKLSIVNDMISSNFKHEHETYKLCAQWDVCHNCSLLEITSLKIRENKTLAMYTAFPVLFVVTNTTGNLTNVICTQKVKLDEHGEYSLYLSPPSSNGSQCNFVKVVQPPDNNIPIYAALGIYIGAALLWMVLQYTCRQGWWNRFRCCVRTESLVESDLGVTNKEQSTGSSDNIQREVPLIPPVRETRLRSLDAFRGLSLIIMIFVNYAGGQYWFFHHTAWDGLTLADLVFPWFVFIMGTSIAIAFRKQLQKSVPRKLIFLKILRRTVILFLLGIMVGNRAKKGHEVWMSSLRIPGVLQRLAITYMVVAILEVFSAEAGDRYQTKWWACVRDILPFWFEWTVALILLGTNILLSFLLKVPGCPTGYLGPGGLHDNSSHVNCTGGAAGHIDRIVFGDSHIYGHPTSTVPYLTQIPYDPEGILGTFTSIFLCFLGLQAGKIIIYHKSYKSRVKRWIIWCLVTGSLAGALCEFKQYGGWIPVNKNLWSISFILTNACMAFALLIIFYLLIDVAQIWSGAPFFYPGMNSILIYLCHEILSFYFPVQFHVKQTHAAQLAMALWGATLWTIVSVVLYRKKIFLAV